MHYYDLVEAARLLLVEAGHVEVAQALADALEGAATSGEAVSSSSVVLNRARSLVDLDARTRIAIDTALHEGQRIWDLSNG